MERVSMIRGKPLEGQMRVVEVILASLVIVFALSFANILAIVPTSPKYEVTELEKLGYNVLHDLDKQGLLSRFVYKREWENLTAALRVTLPLDVSFNMTVYYLDGSKANDKAVFYGDIMTFADSKNMASVTYGLVGYPEIDEETGNCQAKYDPRILILQLSRG